MDDRFVDIPAVSLHAPPPRKHSPGVVARLRELLTDSATYGISSVLSQVVGVLLIPVYTRHLTVEEYGVMAMLTIILVVFGPIAGLGMTNAVFRQFNIQQDREMKRKVLTTGLVGVALGASATFLVGQLLTPPISAALIGSGPGNQLLVRLTLVTALVAAVGQVPNVVLRAERRVRLAAMLNLAHVLVAVCATLYLVVALKYGVMGWVVGGLIGEGAVLVLRFGATRRTYARIPSGELYGRMLAYGLPFVPHHLIAAALAMFGQYIVKNMLGLAEAGHYSVALRFAAPLILTVGAIQKAWVPYKFHLHASDEDPAVIFGELATIYIVFIGMLWLVVSLWGGELIRVMTPVQFHPAANLLPAVASIAFGTGLYYMFGTGYEFSERTGSIPAVSGVGLLVVVSASFLFVPRLGAMGAALATTLGWIAMSQVILRLSRARFLVPYNWRVILPAIAVILLLIIGQIPFQERAASIRLAYISAATLVAPLALLALMLTSAGDRDRLRRLARRLPFRGLQGAAVPRRGAR